MTTATQERIDHLLAAAGVTSDTPDAVEQPLRAAILLALKEQDRDTRYACAEAVSALNASILSITHSPVGALQAAHDACMNTVSV